MKKYFSKVALEEMFGGCVYIATGENTPEADALKH
jgi:hypothetical protein